MVCERRLWEWPTVTQPMEVMLVRVMLAIMVAALFVLITIWGTGEKKR